MTDIIEFEVTASVPSNCKIRLMSHVFQTDVTCDKEHPTTPAEFDVVARKMGYVKHVDADVRYYEHISIDGFHAVVNKSTANTIRRIIADRDNAVASLKNERDAFRTCTIDGVTYRGNEETIGKLRSLQMDCDEEVNQLRGELREAKKASSIPEKWRKAIESVIEGIDKLGAEDDQQWGEHAAQYIVHAATYGDVDDISRAAELLLCWLAAELEKDNPK